MCVGVATSEIRFGKRRKPSDDVKEAVADSKMTLGKYPY